MPDLSIVIPAYREEARLVPSMEKVQGWIAGSGLDVEVVLVTEASPDRTQEVARDLARQYSN
ncbi:MAG: glycosyltransferase, partial [Desulfobacterales bacterium]|nr:glycosyltransferase [Desulfobacterales bacterium]